MSENIDQRMLLPRVLITNRNVSVKKKNKREVKTI